jgi:hypothetical protein
MQGMILSVMVGSFRCVDPARFDSLSQPFG